MRSKCHLGGGHQRPEFRHRNGLCSFHVSLRSIFDRLRSSCVSHKVVQHQCGKEVVGAHVGCWERWSTGAPSITANACISRSRPLQLTGMRCKVGDCFGSSPGRWWSEIILLQRSLKSAKRAAHFSHFGSSHFGSSSGFVGFRCPTVAAARRGSSRMDRARGSATFRVLQGRRPPSVQCPQQQSLQPGHTAINEGQKSTVKSQTMRTGLRPFVDASAKETKASDHVTKIKHALQVDGLRAALKRAESDTKVTPIHVQVKECESFLSRARLHGGARPEARRGKRLVALEACTPPPPPAPSDASSEVQRLQELLSQLQAKVDAQGQDPDVPCVPTVKRFCRSGQGHVQVPFMPNSIPAIWLEERHAELHDALMNGETARVLN